ncbi:VOC family protein [Flavobacterium pectinovorum]|uniref:VOC family protein n=1 Tax=Flavobacterium pectinovorum TaxID=29533 RepID=UPI001FAE411F|nr:VOC family protein [Flavobacterium pectinovorum]MCI9844772.1 VOC family protein [Flavobacterium pectinovorum]
MITINPYLYFNGNCEEAFNFYKDVFETEFKYVGRYNDVPQADKHFFKEQNNKIMHISLPVSNQMTLMGSDHTELHNAGICTNNFSLSITTDNKEEADKLFKKLSEGGKIKLAMNETFWGSYYGIVNDKFGINWKISFEIN